MQSNMINSILKSKWNEHRSSFDADLSHVETYGVRPHYDYDHYLFLKRELEVTADNWAEAKRKGLIRHCKLYRGKFLDYVVQKQFNTIEEWVADAGGTLEDILYGENRVKQRFVWHYDHETRQSVRVPYTPKYVEFKTLLAALGYVPPPAPVEVPAQVVIPEIGHRDLTEMLGLEMRMRGLTINNVYVLNGSGAIVPWKTFIGQ